MVKTIGRLTHQGVSSAALEGGLHGDGNNLFLRCKPDGNRSWVFIYRHNGRQKELGLGKAGAGTGAVSLKAARKMAREGRALLDLEPPVDPKGVWRARPEQSAPTFAEAARDYLLLNAPTWKSAKHAAQWRATVSTFCKPLHKLPVDQITVEDVRAILNPLWGRAPETASRVRNRIAAVIDHGMPADVVQTNPAKWLATKFPSVKAAGKIDRRSGERIARGNFSALAFADAPAFAKRLRECDGVAARALEFLLLTAARTGEVIGAKWGEIDAGLWTVPWQRLKTGKRTKRPHTVPLSPRALAIVAEMGEIATSSDFIFPGHYPNQPLNSDALRLAAKRLDPTITVHGLRSTFTDWAAEKTDFAGELAELALAHVVPGVRGHYRRETGVEPRRGLMAAWDAFLAGPPESDAITANVLRFTRSA